MVKVRDNIKVIKDKKYLEVVALFDTGSGRSYLNDKVAEKLGYEKYPEPLKVPLAVEGKEAEVIGRSHCYLEIARYKLPEEETVGVIKDLREEAIVGLNIIEPYNIILEKVKIRFKEYPPKTFFYLSSSHTSKLARVQKKSKEMSFSGDQFFLSKLNQFWAEFTPRSMSAFTLS